MIKYVGLCKYWTALLTAIVSNPDNWLKSKPVREGPLPKTKHTSLFAFVISVANFIGLAGVGFLILLKVLAVTLLGLFGLKVTLGKCSSFELFCRVWFYLVWFI